MSDEKRLIDISKFPLLPSRLDGDVSEYERGYLDAQANLNLLPIVDAVEVVQFDTLKSLVNGEWVECKLVQEALGIDFATGFKMFDFSRTAEWNPAPLNGQKITTKFRLKNAVVHGQMEEVEIVPNYMRKYQCSCCHSDGERWYKYCPECGATMRRA